MYKCYNICINNKKLNNMTYSSKISSADRFIPAQSDDSLRELSSFKLNHCRPSTPTLVNQASTRFFQQTWGYNSIKEVPILHYSLPSIGKRKYQPWTELNTPKQIQPTELKALSDLPNEYENLIESYAGSDYYKQYLSWSYSDLIAHFTGNYLYIEKFNRTTFTPDIKATQIDLGQEISAVHFVESQDKLLVGHPNGRLTLCLDLDASTTYGNYVPLENIPWKIQAITSQRSTLIYGDKGGRIGVGDLRARLERFIPFYFEGAICSLNLTNEYQLALGTDTNLSAVIDLRKNGAVINSLQHNAAIKALDWMSPNRLITGAGMNDQRLRIWDIAEKSIDAEINTDAQVCHLLWLKNSRHIFACQGFSQHGTQSLQPGLQIFKPDLSKRKLCLIAHGLPKGLQ